jgi:hypothetical protein
MTKTPFWHCCEDSRPAQSVQTRAEISDCNVYHPEGQTCNSLCIDIHWPCRSILGFNRVSKHGGHEGEVPFLAGGFIDGRDAVKVAFRGTGPAAIQSGRLFLSFTAAQLLA